MESTIPEQLLDATSPAFVMARGEDFSTPAPPSSWQMGVRGRSFVPQAGDTHSLVRLAGAIFPIPLVLCFPFKSFWASALASNSSLHSPKATCDRRPTSLQSQGWKLGVLASSSFPSRS